MEYTLQSVQGYKYCPLLVNLAGRSSKSIRTDHFRLLARHGGEDEGNMREQRSVGGALVRHGKCLWFNAP